MVSRRTAEAIVRFPVLRSKPVSPSRSLCPQCGKGRVNEPHSMAILAGGAMRVVDAKAKSAEIAEDCIGFLDLVWHGGHDDGGGADREVDARLPVAEDTPGGQFEFYFCSTPCLRSFLNACVDELEAKIARKRERLS